MNSQEPADSPAPPSARLSFSECTAAANSVRRHLSDRRAEVIDCVRPRNITGLIRRRPPLAVLLYLLDRQGLLIWDGPDEFVVLRRPDASIPPGDRRFGWMRRLDHWWDGLVVWSAPFLMLLLASLMTFIPALRLPALLLVAAALSYTAAAMAAPMLSDLVKFGRRLVRSVPHDQHVRQAILAQNWSIELCHITQPERTEAMLRLTLRHIRDDEQRSSGPAAVLLCDIRCITTSDTQDAILRDDQVTPLDDARLLVVRRPGDESIPRLDESLDRSDPARFVVLFLFAVALAVALLLRIISWPEHTILVVVLLILLGMVLVGVLVTGAVQSARIRKQISTEVRQRMLSTLSESDKAAWGSVFINYRQGLDDSAVASLYRAFTERFGTDKVFMDVPSMGPGTRYPDELRAKLDASAVLITVIHRHWLNRLNKRRRYQRQDWVHYEINRALTTSKTVVPVLLDNAAMPTAHELPADIADFSTRQACHLRWQSQSEDITTIIAAIEPCLRRGG